MVVPRSAAVKRRTFRWLRRAAIGGGHYAAIGGSHYAATVTSPVALCGDGRRWALFPFGQGDDLLGNLAGGMGLGQQVDVLGQALQAAVVADGL